MHAMSFPSTLSVGDPYVVLSSTPGSVSPILRTVSKVTVFLGTLRTVQILLVKFLLLIRQIDRLALDEKLLDLRLCFKGIAISNHQIGPLTLFNSPQLIAHSPDFSRVFRHGFHRILMRQPERHGLPCLKRKVS